MRKYILATLAFFGLFVLNGCGGGSDNISNGNDAVSTAAIETTLEAMEINGDTFNLNILFTKKVDSSYQIELSNFSLSADSCNLSQVPVFTPNVLNMDGGINSFATVNIAGTFDQNCTTTGYTFSATQTSTKDGVVDIRMFSVTYDPDDSGGVVTPVASSGFFNATTPLEITQVDTPYGIKVQMVEDGLIAVGKTVILKPFSSVNNVNGYVSSYTATTGQDGFAVFDYTSPDPLPANGTSMTLELTHDDNGTIITQDIVLNFNNTGLPVEPPVDTSNYLLQAVPSEINVSVDDTSRVLDLYLSDTSLNAPVEGQVITAEFVDPYNGILDRYTAITDATGHVAFTYTRPATFAVGDTFDIIFDVAGGTVPKTATVGVTFVDVNTAPPVDTATYVLTAVPSDINISEDDTGRVLDLYLSDTSVNAPVAGQEITAQFVDPNNGTLGQYTATTDATGHVAFNYTRPEIFTVGDTFDIIFDVPGGTVPTSATVGVTFVDVNAAPPVDTATYVLTSVPSAINISTDDTGRVLDLYLSDTSVNAPVAGQEITAQFVDPNNGTLGQYTATTDATGHVAFNYTRPEIFTVGDTFDIIFDVAGGTVPKTATVAVTFVAVDFDYLFVNETTPILISFASQEEEISVYLVDSNNVGIPDKTLTITTISDGYGSVSTATATTDASGKATFTYTAPNDLTALIGTSTVATLSFTENDTTIDTDVTIMISSAAIISDYSLVNPAPEANISVPLQIAVLDIQLTHTVDGNEIPVIDARPCTTVANTVTTDCVIPAVMPRESGRITGAAGSNASDGYIYFDYLAPTADEAVNGIYELEVYYIDENGEIAATNTLSVNVNITPAP